MAKTKNDKTHELVSTGPNLPAPVIDYGDDFGAGVDDIGRDEAGIPFLKILQAQSPEVIGPNGQIAGAVAGLIMNTGTEQLSESVTIVPAVRQHVFVEWRPRKVGGGIVAVYAPSDPVVKAAVSAAEEFGRYKTEAGNDLVETFYVFAVLLDGDSPAGYVVLPFSSTQIKKYKKKFANRVKHCFVDDGTGRKRNPPMYAHRLTVGTETESNDDGTWKGYAIAFAVNNNVNESLLLPDHPAYQAGKMLKTMVDGGEAQADLSKAEDATVDDDAAAAF